MQVSNTFTSIHFNEGGQIKKFSPGENAATLPESSLLFSTGFLKKTWTLLIKMSNISHTVNPAQIQFKKSPMYFL